MKSQAIQWGMGEVVLKDLQPEEPSEGTILSTGRWSLHTLSTVPFVRITTALGGIKTITWGDVLDIREGEQGKIFNSSAHAGDVFLSCLGESGRPSPRPARYSIPVLWGQLVGVGPPEIFRTYPVDVRAVRRAYIVAESWQTGTYTVRHQARTRGQPSTNLQIGDSPSAMQQNGNILVDPHTIIPASALVRSLGIGSADYLDTIGNTLPELRPMGLLDSLEVETPKPPGKDAFWILEF